jgi:hypothetical protein
MVAAFGVPGLVNRKRVRHALAASTRCGTIGPGLTRRPLEKYALAQLTINVAPGPACETGPSGANLFRK